MRTVQLFNHLICIHINCVIFSDVEPYNYYKMTVIKQSTDYCIVFML